MLAEGRSDQQIVDAQMRQEGLQALVTPPIEGFNSLMWVMPFVMIGIGLLAIWFFIKHMQAERVAARHSRTARRGAGALSRSD